MTTDGGTSTAFTCDQTMSEVPMISAVHFASHKACSPTAFTSREDVDAVLHVGGRLEEAVVLSYDEKHPIILPKKHHLSRLIVRLCHESLAHAGRKQTLVQTRKMFWILGGRGLAKNIIRNCFKCCRLNERPMKQVMAPLPKGRLQLYKPPFPFSGVNFFGPLMVKWGRGSTKRWGCLFTCLTTQAVFLELVPSFETDDFIMAL